MERRWGGGVKTGNRIPKEVGKQKISGKNLPTCGMTFYHRKSVKSQKPPRKGCKSGGVGMRRDGGIWRGRNQEGWE